MYNPSSSSRDDSASEGLPSSVGWASWRWSTWASDSSTFAAKSCSLMEARFIVGGLASCFLLASGGTRALALQPLVAGHVRFVLLDRLMHLMGCQGTSPRNLRIQHVPDLLPGLRSRRPHIGGIPTLPARVGPASPCQGCSRRCLP